ncbi:hypothetical protein A9974_24005 [Achromobacter sp. UMC71]|nr:hypothetical protein [Achromobacter sp. UMC71]MBB1628307.1 hypothetical protein [Achromobacter sp. UMC71]
MLVELADEVEQQRAAGLAEWQIPEFVESNDVRVHEPVGEVVVSMLKDMGQDATWLLDAEAALAHLTEGRGAVTSRSSTSSCLV